METLRELNKNNGQVAVKSPVMRGYFFHAIYGIFSLEWIQLRFGRDRKFVDNLPHYALQKSVRLLCRQKFHKA